jgi:hypothetical protein
MDCDLHDVVQRTQLLPHKLLTTHSFACVYALPYVSHNAHLVCNVLAWKEQWPHTDTLTHTHTPQHLAMMAHTASDDAARRDSGCKEESGCEYGDARSDGQSV